MKNFVFLILTASFFLISAGVVNPQLNEKEVTIGQNFSVVVDIKPGKKIIASLTSKSDSVAVVTAGAFSDGQKTNLNLVALKSGDISVPDIELNIDGKIHTVKSFSVSVTENTIESDMNLRDIRKPVKIMEKDYTLLYILGALVILAALIFIIYFLAKKFKKKTEEIPVVITSVDIADKYLKMAREAKAAGDYESYVDHLTLGLRAYMSHKSEVNYVEMTTSEVRRTLRKDSNFKKFNDRIIDLLKLGDRFKFADEMLRENDFDELYSGFKEILDEVS